MLATFVKKMPDLCKNSIKLSEKKYLGKDKKFCCNAWGGREAVCYRKIDSYVSNNSVSTLTEKIEKAVFCF